MPKGLQGPSLPVSVHFICFLNMLCKYIWIWPAPNKCGQKPTVSGKNNSRPLKSILFSPFMTKLLQIFQVVFPHHDATTIELLHLLIWVKLDTTVHSKSFITISDIQSHCLTGLLVLYTCFLKTFTYKCVKILIY